MEPFRAVGSDYRPPPGTESGEGFVALVGAEIAYGVPELGVQPILGKQQMSRAQGIPAGDRLLDAALAPAGGGQPFPQSPPPVREEREAQRLAPCRQLPFRQCSNSTDRADHSRQQPPTQTVKVCISPVFRRVTASHCP